MKSIYARNMEELRLYGIIHDIDICDLELRVTYTDYSKGTREEAYKLTTVYGKINDVFHSSSHVELEFKEREPKEFKDFDEKGIGYIDVEDIVSIFIFKE